MNIIEQLSLKKDQLRQLDTTTEGLNKVRLLDDIIENLKKEDHLDELSRLKNRKILEIQPGNVIYSFVWDKVNTVLERIEEEQKKPYWTTLISISIDELERELDVWLIFSSNYYGARNLLEDMEEKGEITITEKGTVEKKKLQKKKLHQKKI